MIINDRVFDLKNNTYIMGILNVTPDSFSDGGRFNDRDAALMQTKRMIEEGADVIDIGGESTRPGHAKISAEEEIERTSSIIELVRNEFDIPVSIDTYKPEVALAAVKSGAGLVNDIWGCREKGMAEVIADTGSACCLMHNRDNNIYNSFMEEVINDVKKSIDTAKKAGVMDEQICIDPGVGFAKDLEQNLEVIRKIKDFERLGFPILLGTSRKSFIGKILDTGVEERVEGTMATTAYAVMNTHIAFFRVHDIKENVRIIKMLKAILGTE